MRRFQPSAVIIFFLEDDVLKRSSDLGFSDALFLGAAAALGFFLKKREIIEAPKV